MNDHQSARQADANVPAPSAWNLIELEVQTRFELAPSERIAREAAPDGSPGPLMFLASCTAGVIVRFGEELDERLVQELSALAAREAPLPPGGGAPVHLERYLEVLRQLGPVKSSSGLSFHLPNGTVAPSGATIVTSGTPEAEDLEARLALEGMPPGLLERNYRHVADLWPPYCLLLQDGEIACLAFASRLGSKGVELGLETLPDYRGRGLAAVATAAWSRHPALRNRTLFYSTAQSNLASQRVAAKLGLPLIGPTWEISRA